MKMPNYLYATGVINSLSANLFNSIDLERMVDSRDAEHAFKVLNDTEYANDMNDYKSYEFEKVIEGDLKDTKKTIKNMVPDDFVLQILFFRYDFHNIKVLFKRKYLINNYKEGISELGFIDITKLEEVILNNKNEELGVLNEIVFRLKRYIDDNLDAREIDEVVDRAYFKTVLNLAKNYGNKFILGFIRLQIDRVNLRIVKRSKVLGLDNPMKHLIPGGNNEKYSSIMESGSFEQQLQKIENSYMEKAYNISFGPELIFVYYWNKERRGRNIRTIMAGKLNNIESAVIKDNIV